MNDTHFAPNARYLLQIASNGEWKTVAYVNDFEEAKRTIEKVPAVRVFDTWKQAEVQLRQRRGLQSSQDLETRRIERLSTEGAVRARVSPDRWCDTIAERKLRRGQLTEDGDVEISGRDLR